MTTTLRAADPYTNAHFDPACADARRMLEDIVATPRQHGGIRHIPTRHVYTRRRAFAAAATLAAATAAVITMATVGTSSHHTEALGPSGYRVTTQPDGAVRVVVRWNEVKDPAALQAALDRAQAHTKIWVTDHERVTPWCAGAIDYFGGRIDKDAVQYNTPDGADGLIIRPKDFPTGATLLITVVLSPPGATGATSTGGALPPNMAGLGTVWVTGTPANCT